MQAIIRTIITALILFFTGQAYALTYVVDTRMGDSLQVSELSTVKGKEVVGVHLFKIANGDTLRNVRQIEEFPNHAAIRIDGKTYAVRAHNLCFIEEDGAEDPWNTLENSWRTPKGKFYTSLTPYYYIILLVVGSLLLGVAGMGIKFFRFLAILLMPVMIAAACYLEIDAWLALGTDMFWWCDNDRYGFWGSTLRLLPFTLVLLGQFASYPLYCKLMVGKDGEYASASGVIPMGISLVVSLPVIAIVLLVCALFHMGKPMQEVVGTCLFLGIVGIGSLTTIIMNIKMFGFFKGMWLTVFGLVYLVGFLIAAFGLIMALWNLFVQMVITVVPWALLLLLFMPGSAPAKRELSYEEQKAKDEQEAAERKNKADFFERIRKINEAPFIKGGTGKIIR